MGGYFYMHFQLETFREVNRWNLYFCALHEPSKFYTRKQARYLFVSIVLKTKCNTKKKKNLNVLFLWCACYIKVLALIVINDCEYV